MKIRKSFMISLFVVALAACQTDPDAPSNMPQAPSVQVEEETLTRVGTAVRVTFSGVMADVTVYGVELTDKLFEAGGEIKTLYPETVTEDGFLLSVAGLEPNTNYYLRAFVANGMSKIYSKVITFSTPETSVASVSDVRLEDGMFLTATIEDSGGRSIEDFGFVWGETDDRRSLKRMKRTPGTMGEDGKTFSLPLSALGVGLHYVLAYAEDEKSATGFSRVPHMEDLRPDQAVQFEDSNFERYVVSRFDADGNGKISYAEIGVIESIEVTTDNIRSVREISLMKDLHSLMVSGSGMKDNASSVGKGQLTKLDISANEMLSYVNCSYNAFTSLDFSGNMNLKSINCLGNPMEVLYLSRKQEIETLEVPEGCRIVYVDDEPEEPISASIFMKFMSEGETTLSLTNEGGNAPTLYYSTDRETWAKWDYSALTFTEQQPLFLCGDNPDGFSKSREVYSTFTASGSPFLAEGNIMSLLNKDEEIYEVPAYCFFCAFYNCQQLSFISTLPAETLSQGCYYRMFTNCSSLTSAPLLPATTLADACYYGMFDGCTSLMYAPELKAAALADNCYNSMFYGCTSLTTAPELPATTLVGRCYDRMFADCANLTTAPELPATALTDYCYFGMFRGCTNLESAPELPATTLVPYCYSQMFGNCSNLRYIKCLATDISAEMCVGGWTAAVAQQGTFVRAASMQDWPTGTSGIPGGWTVEVDGEEPVGFEAVDLGLSVMWGNMNIGASTPEDYGGYYAWGETETKEDYSWSTYKWSNGSETSLTKYNRNSIYGTVDNKTELEDDDDVANVVLGDKWRMPMYAELDELTSTRNNANYQWKWKSINGHNGWLITYLVNNNSIFLPAAGWASTNTSINYVGEDGFYWSSSLQSSEKYIGDNNAWYLQVFSSGASRAADYGSNRPMGFSVRPVCEPTITPSNWLTFTSEGETTLSLTNVGRNVPIIYYSTDLKDWIKWDYTDITFTAGMPLYICGDNPDGLSKDSYDRYSHFSTNGDKFSVSGSIMSLISYSEELFDIPSNSEYCFTRLFENCNNLTEAPELPATTLAIGCYFQMFSGCEVLTSAPELPATTLAERCYFQMFNGCSSITTTPELPATTLAKECYSAMFAGCGNLTTTPELPATTLAERCYSSMFSSCSNLTTAPELPATTLAEWCYSFMFSRCRSLTTAPELPSTTLAKSCYYGMFEFCESLSSAPELPAIILETECYYNMFYYCTNLSYVKCLATDISAENCTRSWFLGITYSGGTFVRAAGMTSWPSSESGIPKGWIVEVDGEDPVEPISPTRWLTFVSEGETTLGLTDYGSNIPTLYYSTDQRTWKKWDRSKITFTASMPLYLCGDNPEGFSKSTGVYSNFTASGSPFHAEGSIMSLLNKDDEIDAVTSSCFYRAFYACSLLKTAPELPATTLAESCYRDMFYYCSSLTTAPELPATILAKLCYADMFNSCSGLTSVPELPATTLETECYGRMFAYCRSLTMAPKLPATTLSDYCYSAMFYNCFNINYIKCLATEISASNCLYNWVYGVSQQGTFVKAATMTSWPAGASGIPEGWTVEDAEEPAGGN